MVSSDLLDNSDLEDTSPKLLEAPTTCLLEGPENPHLLEGPPTIPMLEPPPSENAIVAFEQKLVQVQTSAHSEKFLHDLLSQIGGGVPRISHPPETTNEIMQSLCMQQNAMQNAHEKLAQTWSHMQFLEATLHKELENLGLKNLRDENWFQELKTALSSMQNDIFFLQGVINHWGGLEGQPVFKEEVLDLEKKVQFLLERFQSLHSAIQGTENLPVFVAELQTRLERVELTYTHSDEITKVLATIENGLVGVQEHCGILESKWGHHEQQISLLQQSCVALGHFVARSRPHSPSQREPDTPPSPS